MLHKWSLHVIIGDVYIVDAISEDVIALGKFFVLTRASHMAYNYACSMYWKPNSLSTTWKLLSRLNTPKPTTLPIPILLGGRMWEYYGNESF